MPHFEQASNSTISDSHFNEVHGNQYYYINYSTPTFASGGTGSSTADGRTTSPTSSTQSPSRSIPNGKYRIKNFESHNYAVLRSSRDRQELEADIHQSNRGSTWELEHFPPNRYLIRNADHGHFASRNPEPDAFHHNKVFGVQSADVNDLLWIIEETPDRRDASSQPPLVSISPTTESDLLWSFLDKRISTRVTLAKGIGDNRNHWILEPVGSLKQKTAATVKDDRLLSSPPPTSVHSSLVSLSPSDAESQRMFGSVDHLVIDPTKENHSGRNLHLQVAHAERGATASTSNFSQQSMAPPPPYSYSNKPAAKEYPESLRRTASTGIITVTPLQHCIKNLQSGESKMQHQGLAALPALLARPDVADIAIDSGIVSLAVSLLWSPEMRLEALEALARITSLNKPTRSGADIPGVARRVAVEAFRAKCIPILYQLLQSTEINVASRAAVAAMNIVSILQCTRAKLSKHEQKQIADIDTHARSSDCLGRLLSSNSVTVLTEVTFALGAITVFKPVSPVITKNLVPKLAHCLALLDDTVQQNAMIALDRITTSDPLAANDIIPSLVNMLRSPNIRVRRNCLHILLNITICDQTKSIALSANIVPSLDRILSSDNGDVQHDFLVTDSKKSHSKEASVHLDQSWRSDNDEIRELAKNVLKQLQTEGTESPSFAQRIGGFMATRKGVSFLKTRKIGEVLETTRMGEYLGLNQITSN